MDFKSKAIEILEDPNYEKSGLFLALEKALKEAYNEGVEESAEWLKNDCPKGECKNCAPVIEGIRGLKEKI